MQGKLYFAIISWPLHEPQDTHESLHKCDHQNSTMTSIAQAYVTLNIGHDSARERVVKKCDRQRGGEAGDASKLGNFSSKFRPLRSSLASDFLGKSGEERGCVAPRARMTDFVKQNEKEKELHIITHFCWLGMGIFTGLPVSLPVKLIYHFAVKSLLYQSRYLYIKCALNELYSL